LMNPFAAPAPSKWDATMGGRPLLVSKMNKAAVKGGARKRSGGRGAFIARDAVNDPRHARRAYCGMKRKARISGQGLTACPNLQRCASLAMLCIRAWLLMAFRQCGQERMRLLPLMHEPAY